MLQFTRQVNIFSKILQFLKREKKEFQRLKIKIQLKMVLSQKSTKKCSPKFAVKTFSPSMVTNPFRKFITLGFINFTWDKFRYLQNFLSACFTIEKRERNKKFWCSFI
jgi:hypothetical protein